MSKRTRWQPPHPAKDIGVPATPPSAARRRHNIDPSRLLPDSPEVVYIDAVNEQTFWCIWPSCSKTKFEELPLCAAHRAIVANYVDHRTREVQQAQAANIAAVERGDTALDYHGTGGYVYFIRIGDLIKIGYSTQPYQRLRSYPPNAEVLGVFPGTKKVEADLHGRFRFALQKGREWFRDADEILEYVAEMVAHYGPPSGGYVDRFRDAQPRQAMGMIRSSGLRV